MEHFDEAKIRAVLDNPRKTTKGLPNSRIIWKMLQAMYKRQTSLEREVQATIENNGMGFGSYDSHFLSDVAKSSLKYKNLTPAQSVVVAKKLKKYMRQLIEIANEHQEKPAPPPSKRKQHPQQIPIKDWTYTGD